MRELIEIHSSEPSETSPRVFLIILLKTHTSMPECFTNYKTRCVVWKILLKSYSITLNNSVLIRSLKFILCYM